MFHQDYTILNPAGSAVWFCITVPLSPVFLIKYGRMDIYDNPWIYLVDEHGKKKLILLFCSMVYLTAFGWVE